MTYCHVRSYHITQIIACPRYISTLPMIVIITLCFSVSTPRALSYYEYNTLMYYSWFPMIIKLINIFSARLTNTFSCCRSKYSIDDCAPSPHQVPCNARNCLQITTHVMHKPSSITNNKITTSEETSCCIVVLAKHPPPPWYLFPCIHALYVAQSINQMIHPSTLCTVVRSRKQHASPV